MNCPLIVIDRCANGYIVSLPPDIPNEYELIGNDPMLQVKEKPNPLRDKKQEHIFIFDSMEKVLAFISEKFIVD